MSNPLKWRIPSWRDEKEYMSCWTRKTSASWKELIIRTSDRGVFGQPPSHIGAKDYGRPKSE